MASPPTKKAKIIAAAQNDEDVVAATVESRDNEFSDESAWWMVDLEATPPPQQGATPLVRRCIRVHGWSRQYANRVLKAYQQFLYIKKMKEDWSAKILSPSVEVDKMWHLHLLDTVNYLYDCMLLCGHVVGHNPDGMDDEHAKRERFNATKATLLEYFSRNQIDTSEGGVWDEVFYPPEAPSTAPVDSTTTPSSSEGGASDAVTEQEPLNISVRGINGDEVFFKIKRTTRLSRVFQAFASTRGLRLHWCQFRLDGVAVGGDETADSLGLEDGDEIDCVLHPNGC